MVGRVLQVAGLTIPSDRSMIDPRHRPTGSPLADSKRDASPYQAPRAVHSTPAGSGKKDASHCPVLRAGHSIRADLVPKDGNQYRVHWAARPTRAPLIVAQLTLAQLILGLSILARRSVPATMAAAGRRSTSRPHSARTGSRLVPQLNNRRPQSGSSIVRTGSAQRLHKGSEIKGPCPRAKRSNRVCATSSSPER